MWRAQDAFFEPEAFFDDKQRLRCAPRRGHMYWLGVVEPSRESHFFDAAQKFGPLMQLVLPDERPGVFVNRSAVQDYGVVKRLVFKDGSWLEVLYAGPSSDLCYQ